MLTVRSAEFAQYIEEAVPPYMEYPRQCAVDCGWDGGSIYVDMRDLILRAAYRSGVGGERHCANPIAAQVLWAIAERHYPSADIHSCDDADGWPDNYQDSHFVVPPMPEVKLEWLDLVDGFVDLGCSQNDVDRPSLEFPFPDSLTAAYGIQGIRVPVLDFVTNVLGSTTARAIEKFGPQYWIDNLRAAIESRDGAINCNEI